MIEVESEAKINGLLSDSFTLAWAVCQECPLSILLYITAPEGLAIFVDTDTIIKGVHIRDHEIKEKNFVDDTTIFLNRYYLPYQNTSVSKTIRSV